MGPPSSSAFLLSSVFVSSIAGFSTVPPPFLFGRSHHARSKCQQGLKGPRLFYQRDNGSRHSRSPFDNFRNRFDEDREDENETDFYEILGVSSRATLTEIKQAFRNQAKRYHPDNSQTGNTDRFHLLNRAYEILKDEELRRKYDLYGVSGIGTSAASDEEIKKQPSPWQRQRGQRQNNIPVDEFEFTSQSWQRSSQPPQQSWNGNKRRNTSGSGRGGMHMNPNDIMEEQHPRYSRQYGAIMGEDLQVDLQIDLETAVFGGQTQIWVDHLLTCQDCDGKTSSVPGPTSRYGPPQPMDCELCQGTGFCVELTTRGHRTLETQTPCPACQGSGVIFFAQDRIDEDDGYCQTCEGQGRVRKSTLVDVNIPAGMESSTRLRIRGQGNASPNAKGPNGDLFVILRIQPHPLFQRDGMDIHSNHTVDYIDAILGTSQETPVIGDDLFKLSIPAGTQDGECICLPGQGAKTLVGERARGDHFVNIKIEIPQLEQLTDEELDLLLQLQELQRQERPKNIEHDSVTLEPDDSSYDIGMTEDFSASWDVSTNPVDPLQNEHMEFFTLDSYNSNGERNFFFTNTNDTDNEPSESDAGVPFFAYDNRNDSLQDPHTMQSIVNGDSRNIGASCASPKSPKQVYSNTHHEFDQLRELLNAPVKSMEKEREKDARRAREMEEANELVAKELGKLRELLYAPIESTTKASQRKAEKAKRIEEANRLVANEMSKLQELLNAPIESATKASRRKAEKARRIEEANQLVAKELDKLRDLLYSPLETSMCTSPKQQQEEMQQLKEAERRTIEFGKLSDLLKESAFTSAQGLENDSFAESGTYSRSVASSFASSGLGESVRFAAEETIDEEASEFGEDVSPNQSSSPSNEVQHQVASQALSVSIAWDETDAKTRRRKNKSAVAGVAVNNTAAVLSEDYNKASNKTSATSIPKKMKSESREKILEDLIGQTCAIDEKDMSSEAWDEIAPTVKRRRENQSERRNNHRFEDTLFSVFKI